MPKFSQVDLMNGHKQARNSAHASGIPAVGNGGTKNVNNTPLNPMGPQDAGTVRGNGAGRQLGPEMVSDPKPFEDTEHPFSGNRNNQRVAERIARERVSQTSKIVVKPAQDAAAEALAKAAEYEANYPDEFVDTDPDGDGGSLAVIAAGLGATAPKVPTVPTSLSPLGDANSGAAQAEQSAAMDAAVAAAAAIAPIPAVSGAPAGSQTPPALPTAPVPPAPAAPPLPAQ